MSVRPENKEGKTPEINRNLSLSRLREVNVLRCGEVFHPVGEWSATDWACALAGEAGEAANVAKKIKRLETGTNQEKDPQTLEEAVALMRGELADVVIYADLLAARLGINLSDAICEKFNAVSRARKSTHFL